MKKPLTVVYPKVNNNQTHESVGFFLKFIWGICLFISCAFCLFKLNMTMIPIAQANVHLELSAGINQASGSDLKSEWDLAYKALVGWMGRPQWMNRGDALCLCGGLSYEALIQRGPQDLGSPTLTRKQITPIVNARYYKLMNAQFRVFGGLGLGYSFDHSSVQFTGLDESSVYQRSSGVVEFELGLQYKLSAGLNLNLGFSQLFYTSANRLALPERVLQISRQNTINGRQRLLLGMGFYL